MPFSRRSPAVPSRAWVVVIHHVSRRRATGRGDSVPSAQAMGVQLPPERRAADAEFLGGGAPAAVVPFERGDDPLPLGVGQ